MHFTGRAKFRQSWQISGLTVSPGISSEVICNSGLNESLLQRPPDAPAACWAHTGPFSGICKENNEEVGKTGFHGCSQVAYHLQDQNKPASQHRITTREN
jgi:hypothetical protein